MVNDNPIGPQIGDYPWPMPYNPYVPGSPTPPWVPQVSPTILSTGTTTNKLFPKENKMDVYMIWAISPDHPDAPYLVSAWDSETRSENEDGWLEDLAAAEEIHGARHIRITRSSVNYDAVVAAFTPTEV